MPKERRFTMPWGGGVVEEEVQCENEWIRPTIQLLRYDDPKMGHAIRFCIYNQRGGFSRNPLMVDESDLRALGKALRDSPKLRKALQALLK